MEETHVRLGLERRIGTRGLRMPRGSREATIRIAGWRRRSPEDRHTVLPKHAVGGDDREVIFKRLRDEKSIERIPMAERQVRDSNDMSEPNIQQREAVDAKLLGNEPIQAFSQPKLAETELDGKLPAAGDAEKDLVIRVGDSRPCSPPDCGRALDPPEERVRVEQQFHPV